MTTLLSLVRHGETDWNAQHRIQGMTDIPLNRTGREQARDTGRRLAGRRWDRVFSSPLSRAFETASIIAAELRLPEPVSVAEVVERDYGAAEGMSYGEIEATFGPNAQVPGQEDRAAVTARVVPALLELARRHPESSLLVVSHGGAIRSVLTAVEPDGSHGRITNGSVHSFEVADGVLRLLAFDDPLDLPAGHSPTGEPLDDQNAVEAREDGAA